AEDVAKTGGKTLTEKPSWLPSRVITGNIDNPKGLIGVYEKNIPGLGKIDDTKRMLSEIDYPMCSASDFKTTSQDGFKMLNVPNDAADMWATYNKPWLEDLTNNKADVVVLSDKSNDLLKYVLKSDGSGAFETLPNGQKILTGFGKEIDYMENLVKQRKYQWDELNGLYKYIGN
ncbi:MAG: hypothetical protein Q8907_15130, partial [Bacteroidota bacterium]|nr:hypothetical protein [Bacteroidota bacterium]